MFLFKLTNVIAGVIGLVQALLPIVKELIIVCGRIVAVFFPNTTKDEEFFKKVDEYYDKFAGYFEKFKKIFLDMRSKNE